MIDPRGLTVQQWCDATALDLSSFIDVPILRSADDWVKWATSVSSNTTISTYQAPDPRGFSDWREWAMRFVQAVAL